MNLVSLKKYKKKITCLELTHDYDIYSKKQQLWNNTVTWVCVCVCVCVRRESRRCHVCLEPGCTVCSRSTADLETEEDKTATRFLWDNRVDANYFFQVCNTKTFIFLCHAHTHTHTEWGTFGRVGCRRQVKGHRESRGRWGGDRKWILLHWEGLHALEGYKHHVQQTSFI